MAHLQLMCLMVTVLAVETAAAGVNGQLQYVSVNGQDNIGTDCGSDAPCASIRNAVSNLDEDGTVYIIAEGSDVKPFFWCRDGPLVITSSVVFSSYNDTAHLGCERGSGRMLMFNVTSFDSDDVIDVIFQDLVFTDSMFHVSGAKVTFKNCTIRDSKWISSPDDPHVGIQVIDSDWVGSLDDNCTSDCVPTADLQIMAEYLDLYMSSSRFYHSQLKITASQSTSFLIEGCVFSNLANVSAVHGGIYLTVGNGTKSSDLVLRDSLFEHQYHSDPIHGIMNLYEAAMLMRVVNRASKGKESNVTAYVENCQFRNNERGLTFIGPFAWTNVSSSTFTGNIAMHAGAGILYLTGTNGYMQNCTFDTNSAGAFRPGPVDANQDSFRVVDDEVHINSDCCNGVIGFVGKGGAIRLQRGTLTLVDCTFRNNTARQLGGSIFVDRESSLTIENTLMENSPIYMQDMQGDLVYSNGHMVVRDVRLVILTAKNNVAMVRHWGDHWSIDVVGVSLICPINYHPRVTNSSAYGVSKQGLRRSHKLDQLSYFCESCPSNTYSLDQGFMNSSRQYSSFAHYTILINGEKPDIPYSGIHQHHKIECSQCPYGGQCQQGIRSMPNFWGYSQKDQLLFQHCPNGYCRASSASISYDECDEFRTGTLCGQCLPGYSESLFSAKCFPDDACGSAWLWPVVVLSGLLYALFIIFQNDLALFVKGIIAKFPRPGRCMRRGNDEENDPVISLNLEESPHDSKTLESPDEGIATTQVTGTGFLTIFFYYFQDAQLLQVTTVFFSMDSETKNDLKGVLSAVFMFSVDQLPFIDNGCFLPGLTPSKKMLFKAMFVGYVLLQLGIIYVVYHLCQKIKGTISGTTVLSRLSTGAMFTFLLTYQGMATTSFALLNCVSVGDSNVLFLQGTITCYEWWQIFVLVYVLCCIVPFCLVLVIGPGLLKDGLITLTQFFCGCILPLPFVVYWVFLRMRLRREQHGHLHTLSAEVEAVINVLQGPFKESESKILGPICGSGILIGRRLILVLIFTFVNNILVRMLCMQFVCFIILVRHMHVLPYKVARVNLAGGASASLLLIISSINLVRAAFEAAQYVPHGPNVAIMRFFEVVEGVLLLWIPALILLMVILSVVVMLVLKLFRCRPCSRLTG